MELTLLIILVLMFELLFSMCQGHERKCAQSVVNNEVDKNFHLGVYKSLIFMYIYLKYAFICCIVLYYIGLHW